MLRPNYAEAIFKCNLKDGKPDLPFEYQLPDFISNNAGECIAHVIFDAKIEPDVKLCDGYLGDNSIPEVRKEIINSDIYQKIKGDCEPFCVWLMPDYKDQ